MNWVKEAKIRHLKDFCIDYVESLNLSVASIAWTIPDDKDLKEFGDKFIGKYNNLNFWDINQPYLPIKITGPTLDLCMQIFRQVLDDGDQIYLLGVFIEPDDKITIKYSTCI